MNFYITDFGAFGDGVTLNTVFIQRAIDTCFASGGGRVTVPTGVYKTGTLWLRSHVELYLEAGAELLASDDIGDYNSTDAYEQNYDCLDEGWGGQHLIIAHEIEDTAITGLGRINGNLHSFVYRIDSSPERVYGWCHGRSMLRDKEQLRPGQLICFIECRGVKVSDITIVDSPCWSCFLLGCEDVQIRGVRIKNPIWMLNSDGIDVDSSRRVTISDCIIETGDDAITLRGCERRVKNKNMHCELVTVTNCVLSTGICAFRIGVGDGHIRGVTISNITIERCLNIVQLCTAYSNKGKVDIENVLISNVYAANTDRCFEMFSKNGAVIKNITLDDIRTTSTVKNYAEVTEGAIENLKFRNIEIDFFDRSKELHESMLAFRGDSLLSFKGVECARLDGVELRGSLCGIDKTFTIENCKDIVKENTNF